jgi:hypothetical protein
VHLFGLISLRVVPASREVRIVAMLSASSAVQLEVEHPMQPKPIHDMTGPVEPSE